jgi:hypothetical protein
MRKFTMLVALVAMASFTFAQMQGVYGTVADKNAKKLTQQSTKAEGDVVWEVTFEEASPVWTFGHSVGSHEWQVADTTPNFGYTNSGYEGGTVPVPPLWIYMGWRYVSNNSESGGNFAYIDGISDLLGVGPNTAEELNAWIQFDNIDLTGVAYPKLSFYQNYKALNAGASYIDFSVDGGTTWTEVQINENVEGNSYGDILFEKLVGTYIANEANVSLRFRWTTAGPTISDYGYGWEIDDIRIVENPNYDLKVIDTRMNFFQYIDYTDPANAAYFHYSSHYGQVPDEQFESEFAAMWFNVMLENKGNFSVTPDVNVTVFDPNDVEVYNETVTGAALNVTMVDTVDLIETDFIIPVSNEYGEYTVVYTVTEDGQTDFSIEDNIDTTYFNITDNIMGRDVGNVVSTTGPGTWLDGGVDGEMIGTTYLFLYNTEITSMWVYIGDGTTENTAIVAHVMEFSEADDDWIDLGSSSLHTITAGEIDGWVEFTFADPVYVEIADGDDAKEIMASVEFYYNGDDNDIWVGYDPSINVSIWGTLWYLMAGSNAQSWTAISNWSRGGLGLRLETNDIDVNVEANVSENINIYPNPTTGMLNITNVEGSSIQILNLMGQVIESIESASDFNTVDMSAYAEGTYIVRVMNGNEVNTSKVNIMK